MALNAIPTDPSHIHTQRKTTDLQCCRGRAATRLSSRARGSEGQVHVDGRVREHQVGQGCLVVGLYGGCV